MNKKQFNELRHLLKMYRLDLEDRQRHAQQTNMDAKLLQNSQEYLKARGNDAFQILADIESEMAD